MNGKRILCAAALGLLLSGCREAVGPYVAPERPAQAGDLVQLTFGTGDERDPQWDRDGGSILYHTDVWFDAPTHRGTLLRIPAAGGLAAFLLPDAQRDPIFRLLLPVPSPDGSRIAYLHMLRERPPRTCTLEGVTPPVVCPVPAPLLDTAVLRVRSLSGGGSVYDDVGVGINYEGASRAVEPPFVDQVFPYHLEYTQSNEVTGLRASWSPDGTRLVFSDGLRLLLWRVGDAAATPIPNTADGLAPQWSPDGQRIAFEIAERGNPRTVRCNCSINPSSPPILAIRTDWTATRRIATIRPDGTELRVLGEGREPAWTPGSDSLYFRRLDIGLFRIAAAGGSVSAIANTQGARAPVLARDGSAVAFGRYWMVPNQNLWTLRLRP